MTVVNGEGAQTLPALVRILHCLGVEWLVLADGDAEGKDARARIWSVLGDQATANEHRVVMLPDDESIEDYFARPEFEEGVYAGIAERWGGDALEDWRARHHGMKRKGGEPRDYEAEGWEVRLRRDFLQAHKPDWPRSIVPALVEAGSPPEKLAELLSLAGGILDG